MEGKGHTSKRTGQPAWPISPQPAVIFCVVIVLGRASLNGTCKFLREVVMDPDVISFVVVSTVTVVLFAAVAAIGVWVVRTLRRKSAPPEISNRLQIEERFDQIQQAVDAIAVEVERITEAQRFSARLLAERAEPRAIPRQ